MLRAIAILLAVVALQLTGCGDGDKPKTNTGGPTSTEKLPDTLFVTTAPAEPKDIIAAKASVKEGDEVVIRGVIGGKEDPFIKGIAVVNVVDMSVPSCADNGEECPTPWDYCCVPPEEIAKSMATIRAVNANGEPLKVSMNAGDRLKPYNVVVVRGKVAPRENEGVLVINASEIYVESEKKKK